MTLGPLDPFSLVTDEQNKFTREWYQWLVDVSIQSGVARPPVPVANLPVATQVSVGTKAYVSDAVAATFGTAVTGGGTLTVPVYSDGTNWLMG